MSPTLRWLLVLVAVPLTGFLLYQQTGRLIADPKILPIDDFVEYWAAGRLNAQGEDPYDPNKLLPLEQAAGRDTDEAIMMWNPPWTLTLAMPFASLPSRTAQLLWVACGLSIIVLSADRLWILYGGVRELRPIAWGLAFTFMPSFFVLHSGQIGTWILGGIVLFLYFERRGWPLLAGASTVLLAIKPHLLYLFWIMIFIRGIRRERRLLVGGLIAGVVVTVIPLLFNHQLFRQYWEAMTQRPPAQWKSPTLGTLIRMIENDARFGLQFLPGVLGMGWLIIHTYHTRDRGWNWLEEMPMLLLVSFVTASYGAWPFDLILLLPAMIAVTARLKPSQRKFAVATWIAINGAALALNILQIGSFSFIWMAPSLLLIYLLFANEKGTA